MDRTPLGYVQLATGPKAIYPMNDIFLNYTFEDAAHWEALRATVNLVIDAYRASNTATSVQPIVGRIQVILISLRTVEENIFTAERSAHASSAE